MATNDCGCNSSSSPECPSTTKKFFISEVEEQNAETCSTERQCAFNTPFYDETLSNTAFTIASVGGAFIVQVCDNSRWAEGQWVYIPNAGKYEIIAKDGCSNLYLRNGCGSGEAAEAIPGNVAPGKTFTGVQRIWLSNDPGCGGDPNDDYCVNVLNAIADCDQSLCKVLDSVDDDDGDRLVSATFQGEGLLSCFRKAADILVKNATLCFPSLPQNSISANDSGVVQDVQRMPGNGCLVRRELPSRNAIDVYCGGSKQYLEVPSDFASKNYSLGIDGEGCPVWEVLDVGCDLGQTRHPITTNLALNTGTKTINTTNRDQEVDFSSIMPEIPDCAGQVSVEVLARLRVTATLSNSFPTLSVKVNQDGVNLPVALQHSHPSFHYDVNTSILKLDKDDPKLTFVCAREGATSGGQFSLQLFVLAFHY